MLALRRLASAFFWTAMLIIVVYAMWRFFKDRFGTLSEGEGAERIWWHRLLLWLRDLWHKWLTWRHEIQVRLAQSRTKSQDKAPVTSRLLRFLSLRKLPARELVRYFYLSAAKRAAQAGQPRQPSQTPHEYQASLDHRFPDLEPDLAGLTDAFVEARYSHRPVQQEDAEAIKPLWQRIKAALRRRRVKL